MCRSLFFAACTVLLLGCKKASWETPKTHRLASVNLYGGSEEDIAHAIIATQDGGFAVLGNTKSTNGSIVDKTVAVSDLVLLKFNTTAQLEWVKTYGGSKDDRGHSLVQLSDGGFAVVGYAMSSDLDASENKGQHDNWVLRLDAQGTLLWEKSFGFLGHDHAYNIIATADAGFLFNGFLDVTSSAGQGATTKKTPPSARHGVGEFWVHKIDAYGEIQWRRYYGGTNNDRSYDAIEANDGYYILGTSESNDVEISNARGSYDVWLIKIDQRGNLLWEKSYGGTAYDAASQMFSYNNRLYIIGNTFSTDKDVSSPHGKSDAWLLVVDHNGELLRESTYGGSEFEVGQTLALDNEGKIWLAGYGQSQDGDFFQNKGSNDMFLMQLDAQLFPKQQFHLGGSGEDFAYDLLCWKAGKIVVVGTTESSDDYFQATHGNKDIFVAIWDENNE